jgi:hypothetical protein
VKTEDLIAVILAALAAAKWLYEYSHKLRWERSKFLLERIQEFKQKPHVKVMHTLLDWNSVSLEIGGSQVHIDDEILAGALQTHDKKNRYSSLEFDLRSVFDAYFDDLSELILLKKTGLVREKELLLYIRYWIDIMNGNKKSKKTELVDLLKNYLIFYGYQELHDFVYKKVNSNE